MRLYATGLDGDTFEPLYPVLDEDTFGEAMEAFFEARIEGLKALRGGTGRGTHFRGEIERRPLPDQGNPRAVGWTFLIDKDDPEGPAISEILAPLARHRGMADPRAPLIYDAAVPVWDWLDENYFGLGLDDQPPYYVLIAAGPRRIPFQFQSLLDSAAAVGRVCFDDLEHLRTYVKKVIALETAARPVARREVVFWAPDGGPSDATYYSRLYMAQPLAGEVRKQGFKGTSLLGEEATKAALLQALSTAGPALAYTASHGLGPPSGPLALTKRVAGALCGQHRQGEDPKRWLLPAEELPESTPFLEGGIFFQFACFGYGVPAQSDFSHWTTKTGTVQTLASEDFVSAIPKRLLANPRGPVAFIGHVDTAWLHGFADPNDPDTLDRWSPRLAPFKRAVDLLVGVQPSGLAMNDLNKQFDIGNAMLANYLDRVQRGTLKKTAELRRRLVDQVIRRSDAQNYMVFGDPAARVRIATD